MPDYGHSLKFGVVLTPLSENPAELVSLATLAEAKGLDLVGAIDHPYRPDFLDTATLLTFIAARTQRITVFSDVTCLPLRPPAIVAKAMASLSLLSGDRVALGLGAGGLWQHISSYGGPSRSPGEAVDALSEAVDVIRALGTGTEKVVYEGRFYHLDGAFPGPVAGSRLPLWIGAYQPRMLSLIGEKGDGWIPSDLFLPPTGLAQGNKQIDEAAIRAGRSPNDIRRLYNISGHFPPHANDGGFLNGPPAQWAEQLAELALTEGVSTFILSPNDNPVEQVEAFASEVVPAVVEAVNASRS